MDKVCANCKYYTKKQENSVYCKKIGVSLLVSSTYVCKKYESVNEEKVKANE